MNDVSPVIIKLHADPDSPDSIEFFRRLGICISLWAFVDRSLYQIFHHASGLEQEQSALKFFGFRAFGARLDLVHKAAKAFLLTEIYNDEWKPLLKEAHELSATRNILAHHPTLRTATSKDGKPLDIYSIYIEPYERILNRPYPGLLGKEALEVGDLISHADAVEDLRERLRTFAWRVGGFRAAAKSGL